MTILTHVTNRTNISLYAGVLVNSLNANKDAVMLIRVHGERFAIGFEPDAPYTPVGGLSAINDIIDGQGLTLGAKIYLIPVEHVYSDCYKIKDSIEVIRHKDGDIIYFNILGSSVALDVKKGVLLKVKDDAGQIDNELYPIQPTVVEDTETGCKIFVMDSFNIVVKKYLYKVESNA